MNALLLKLLPYGIAAALAVAAVLYVNHLRSSIDDLTQQLATSEASAAVAREAAKTNAAAVEQARVDGQKMVRALEAERAESDARAAELSELRAQVESAPAEDDGPLAPVLRNAIIGKTRSAK
ncbi:hypothetical protein [Pleomorphomonas carboxyditropha]|uniref:Uncharacterized protein n=1 Tax=Pleomorphomonas carboxyditropha TaxID=2023338 RepID=A0A2G9X1B4_9HYPH|nr:hypothetical protein [Pleomorphomonas carboxyditropha]PIP00694.1 hypothetical protein CJ014_00895 [Pleomorphomonas carboxyditropha]